MTRALLRHLASETDKLRQAGLFKPERPSDGRGPKDDPSIDFTSSDFLGLSTRQEVGDAAIATILDHGHGVSSPRPFGGTRSLHHSLEKTIAEFIGVADAIVYSSGYLAHIGLFDALFDARDYVLVDAAIHPSLAEGIRLCGARAQAYRSEDLQSLDDRLKRSRTARFRVVVTDGVYPLTGNLAPLAEICHLADRYDALVVVYDGLGVGVLGERQRGSLEHHDVAGRVDVVTGDLADVFGGVTGGYVAGRTEVVTWLRQKSTPYLFSGALAPGNAGAAMAAFQLVAGGGAPAADVRSRTADVKAALEARGFVVSGGQHAILTVGVGDAVMLQRMINSLSEDGLSVQGMCYPVVAENRARIQLKITATHTESVLQTAVERLAQAAETLQLL